MQPRANPGHYLDSAVYGLPSNATLAACATFLDQWRDGTGRWVEDWDAVGERSRALYADALGVPVERVALMPSTSVGVGIVAQSLRPGSRVLVAREDFTSVLYPFLERERASGDLHVEAAALTDLADRVGPGTTLVAASHVQSAGGEVLDTGAVLAACREVGARLLLDVTQAAGSLPRQEAWAQADYVVGAAYKWLCAPRGVAFVSTGESAPPLVSLAANWRGAEEPYRDFYGPPLRLAAGIRRLDVSLPWLPWVGASVALEEFAVPDAELECRHGHVQALLARVCEATGAPTTGSGIVTIATDPGVDVTGRLEAAGVRASVRAGRLRIGVHAYNTAEDVDALLDCLEGALPAGVGEQGAR